MATTLHASHNFDTTAADEMDLRSDNGLDFGDGDIELDLAPPDFRDDDVSIKDAQEDVITADQDDEMADPDGGLGEETAQYGTQENYVSPSNNAADFEPVDDEDVLIDYSDEEVEIPAYPFESPDDPVGGIHVAGNESEEQQAQDAQTNVRMLGSANDDQAVPEHFTEDTGTVQHAANEGDEGEKEEDEGEDDDEEDEEEELQQHYAPEFDADNEADAQTDGEDGGVELQDSKAQTKNSEHGDDTHEDHSPSEIRPITVNYEGNELWLFKQHDVDDSGDWFLEDSSLVHSSLKDLLQAFRVALGEDISHETELGFRFDHLHNMELFEDNTACVAVSLERLVELYHDLHAQDENHDPESFYMSVLSRPRFITLLADIAKYAEQGSGFSGLAAAIAAGETHFLEALSGHSTDYDAGEWENEEAEQHESTELAIGAEPEVEHAEHEEQGDGDESRDDDQEQTEERVEHDDASTSGNITHADQVLQTENDPTAEGHADCSEEFVHDQATEQQEGNENYTIDYSDAGDPEEDEVSHSVTHDVPSPSSSTVQGDESAPGEVSTHTVDSGKHEETHDSDEEGVDYDAENNDGTHPLIEEHVGPEEKTESYQEYAEAYDQEDPFEGLQPYSTEASVDGDTNQEYTGYEYEDLDQQLEDDFITGADLDETSAGGSADAGLDLTGGDDLLDLENAPEWFVDEESTSKVAIDLSAVHDIVANTTQHEEKDGVVEQPVVAASSAADPVAASSEDPKESPVQGQKRSIDEVGDSVGDALDLTDMKRPRV